MIILRLSPKSNLNKIWNYVENNMIKEDATKYVIPLYATQAEGMMSVGVIFDVKDPENIAHFLTENLTKCEGMPSHEDDLSNETSIFPDSKK